MSPHQSVPHNWEGKKGEKRRDNLSGGRRNFVGGKGAEKQFITVRNHERSHLILGTKEPLGKQMSGQRKFSENLTKAFG